MSIARNFRSDSAVKIKFGDSEFYIVKPSGKQNERRLASDSFKFGID